jgi:ligand-binding SRPBCC domain-containing protein
MKYRHTVRVHAMLAQVADFHTQATSLKAITPPLIPMHLHRAPRRLGEGDEMDLTMWMGPLPLLFVYPGWRTRQLLEAGPQ